MKFRIFRRDIPCKLSPGLKDIRLLLWKNFLIQYRHKIQSAFELFVPCFLVLIVVGFRLKIDAKRMPTGSVYTPLPLNEINVGNAKNFVLFYHPFNARNEMIIKETVQRLKIPSQPKFNSKFFFAFSLVFS